MIRHQNPQDVLPAAVQADHYGVAAATAAPHPMQLAGYAALHGSGQTGQGPAPVHPFASGLGSLSAGVLLVVLLVSVLALGKAGREVSRLRRVRDGYRAFFGGIPVPQPHGPG
jgi:hypothetical protein